MYSFLTYNIQPRLKMNITVGSTSIHKLDAVRQACEKLKLEVIINGVKAPSGQNEQPVGFEENLCWRSHSRYCCEIPIS
jgi:hypothetical protein